ncbi:hypothetical protein [Candidatus Mycalebacterium sp.]
MRKSNWIIMFFLAVTVAVPASAVELSLGGFPSYMSTRARYISGATYKSASATKQDDTIFFVDTTLRLTPQLQLTDSVTVRAQVDVFDNNIWGGQTDQLLGGGSTLVNSGISPSDKFRGTILHGNANSDCLSFGKFCAVEEDAGFFNVRMLHADVVLPNNLGFIRVGRQPFDWGLGILANGGWDPHSDGGFLVDRFLWLKTFSSGEESTFTLIFVSDRITQGTGLNTGGGDGWDGGAVAGVFNHPNAGGLNFTAGAYVFPYIHQDTFIGGFGDLDRYTLYSGLVDLKGAAWRFAFELQGGFGEIQNILGAEDSKIKNAVLFALRTEYSAPGIEYLNNIGVEFGWADGDKNDGDTWVNGSDIEGGVIVFNPAYNLDNLLFKHVMPSIYQDAHGNILAKTDASVQNAYYTRVYADIPITGRVSFKPQILVGWNQQTDGLIRDVGFGNISNSFTQGAVDNAFGPDAGRVVLGAVDSATSDTVRARKTATLIQPKTKSSSYLGTEIEGTVTVEIHPGVDLDIIGSVIFAGEGLTDLLEAQAFARENDSFASQGHTNPASLKTFFDDQVTGGQKAEDLLWGVQTRLIIYIDEFFKSS